MNEHIKQLAEQCGFRSNPDIYDRNQSFDITKFAELIIQECHRAVLEVPVYYRDYRHQIEQATIEDCARAVLEHFETQDKPVLQSGGLHYRHPPASEE
jgi:hypothetical protein